MKNPKKQINETPATRPAPAEPPPAGGPGPASDQSGESRIAHKWVYAPFDRDRSQDRAEPVDDELAIPIFIALRRASGYLGRVRAELSWIVADLAPGDWHEAPGSFFLDPTGGSLDRLVNTLKGRIADLEVLAAALEEYARDMERTVTGE